MSDVPGIPPTDFLEMRLDSISVTNVGFIVFLKTLETEEDGAVPPAGSSDDSGSLAAGDRVLPLFIGANEAQSIAMALGEELPPRPMTHDLLKSMLDTLDATVTRVEITDLREGTFYGKVRLLRDDIEETEFDARPSDAIALALRFEAPIYAARSVFEEAAVSVTARETDADSRDDASVEPASDEAVGPPLDDAPPLSPAEKLRAELDTAVAAERYEEAARLRDALKRLSSGN